MDRDKSLKNIEELLGNLVDEVKGLGCTEEEKEAKRPYNKLINEFLVQRPFIDWSVVNQGTTLVEFRRDRGKVRVTPHLSFGPMFETGSTGMEVSNSELEILIAIHRRMRG